MCLKEFSPGLSNFFLHKNSPILPTCPPSSHNKGVRILNFVPFCLIIRLCTCPPPPRESNMAMMFANLCYQVNISMKMPSGGEEVMKPLDFYKLTVLVTHKYLSKYLTVKEKDFRFVYVE